MHQPDVQVISQPHLKSPKHFKSLNLVWFPPTTCTAFVFSPYVFFKQFGQWLIKYLYYKEKMVKSGDIFNQISKNGQHHNGRRSYEKDENVKATVFRVIWESNAYYLSNINTLISLFFRTIVHLPVLLQVLPTNLRSKGLALCHTLWLRVCPGYFRVWVLTDV